MQTSTVICPAIGTEAYFTFKEPVTFSLKNRLGINSSQILLKVAAINEIKEMLQSELRDPFLEAYAPANIEQAQYNQDLIDNVQILTFKFTALDESVKYVRVPLTFVESYDAVADIVYIDRTFVINLGPQHQDIDFTPIHADLIDYIKNLTGITGVIREVGMGDPINVTPEEHQIRENIRIAEISVYKTKHTQYEELSTLYNNLVARINDLGISLG